VKLGNVNVTFLDHTNLLGYDGQDFAKLGKYSVETRLGMITSCNSANFNDVDGIIGFGWADQNRSAAILKTLTQDARPHWNIQQPPDYHVMPRKFAFTATEELGELQLGGYDPASIAQPMQMFPMAGFAYGVNVTSIKYGDTELLSFQDGHDAYVGEFDSGTTCLLIPNTTVNGTFEDSPFMKLLGRQNMGETYPLVYTIGGQKFEIAYEECVEPASRAMILGDPWFRKWIVMHDLTDLNNKKMGLALRSPSYRLGIETDGDSSKLSTFQPLSKLRADRKVRPMALALTQASYGGERVVQAQAAAQNADEPPVDKVALKSQSRVTYNVKLSIGSPPQPLEVIFDTGSFMLAVFADSAPAGMKPILDLETGAEAGEAAAGGRWSLEADRLGWILDGSGDVLVAANVALLAVAAAAVAYIARSRRERKPVYVPLDGIIREGP
jgi:hypothetical protein